MKKSNPTRPVRPSEEGYMLVAVIFMLALLTIALSIGGPKIAKQIQRDREVETMQRGKQYTRAIRMYYKKFQAYPPNLDALVKTNEIRFLRKKYVDPTTGKEEWKAIHFGQAKTQTMGFFGQPLAGTGMAGGSLMAGIGPSGGNGLNGASPIGGGSIFGAGGPQGGSPGAPGSPGVSGANPDPNAIGGDSSGQTFGGVGIIGFSPNSPKQSILVLKKKNHYNEWEFVYDPLSEMGMMGANNGLAPGGGTPPGGTMPNPPSPAPGQPQPTPPTPPI